MDIMEKKLMTLNDAPCSVCKAEFVKTALDEHGRCFVCAKQGLMPGLKARQDFVQSEEMEVEKIKAIVIEVLAEIKKQEELDKKVEAEVVEEAEGKFAPKECTMCHNMFVPRAPAQKVCDPCREAMRENK